MVVAERKHIFETVKLQLTKPPTDEKAPIKWILRLSAEELCSFPKDLCRASCLKRINGENRETAVSVAKHFFIEDQGKF